MDDLFWEGLKMRLDRMASAGQLDVATGPAARYRLPQMNRLDTMALMATWQLQQQEQVTERASAHSEARHQVRAMQRRVARQEKHLLASMKFPLPPGIE